MDKIKIILLTAVLTLTFLCSGAGEKANFLWKVTGADGKDKAYLLGSVHIVPDDIYPLSSKIENAYESSEYIVVEADMNKIDFIKVQQLTMEKGIYTDGSCLEDEISEELYKKLGEALTKTGMVTIDMAKMMKPWLVALTVPQLMILKMGYKADNGIDMHFLKKADKDRKKILELESAEFQIGLLSGFSEELQKKFLESSLDELDSFKDQYDSMIKAWKEDDVAQMEKLVNKEYDDNPDLKDVYKKLIYDRNVTMTEKIDGYLNDKSADKYFIIIGAAHLIDKDGIVKMLAKKGHKIKKM